MQKAPPRTYPSTHEPVSENFNRFRFCLLTMAVSQTHNFTMAIAQSHNLTMAVSISQSQNGCLIPGFASLLFEDKLAMSLVSRHPVWHIPDEATSLQRV